VAVFIDYQNVYRGARAAFGLEGSPHMAGQIFPRLVGLKIKGVGGDQRELTAVHVYRGVPSSRYDPKAFGAAQRQIELWTRQALVVPRTRPLNYRDPDAPREKGIDVLLAVDFVTMALNNAYDVGVIFSADTDLLPALEAVAALRGDAACEVACWKPSDRSARRLVLPGKRIYCHYLSRSDYDHVADATDYTAARRRR
jgi:hypothetical protein